MSLLKVLMLIAEILKLVKDSDKDGVIDVLDKDPVDPEVK